MNLSYSKINTFLSCPKKYDIYYNKRIVPIETKDYFSFGTYFHKIIENIITEEQSLQDIINDFKKAISENETDEEKIAIEVVKFEVLANGFIKEYKNFFKNFSIIAVEEKEELTLTKDFNLQVIIDMVLQHKVTKKIYIIDHKTTSMSLDSFNSISNKMQPFLYSYAVKHLYDLKDDSVVFIYNIIRKFNKLLKVTKKDGNIENFKKRLEQKLADEKYFKMFNFEIQLNDLLDEKIENHINYFIASMSFCQNVNYYPCSELSCELFGGCEYKEYCKNNFKMNEKYKRKE